MSEAVERRLAAIEARMEVLELRVTSVSDSVASIMDNHAAHHEWVDDALGGVLPTMTVQEQLDRLEALIMKLQER